MKFNQKKNKAILRERKLDEIKMKQIGFIK